MRVACVSIPMRVNNCTPFLNESPANGEPFPSLVRAWMDGPQTLLSNDLSHRLAAIDVGTNSLRLIIAEALRGDEYRILDEEKETTRLGKTLASTGGLDPAAVELSLKTLGRMKQIADGFQVNALRTIATSAVREATNGEEFRQRAREEHGIEVEVIEPEEEARLAYYSLQKAFNLTDKNVALADIGGGSTEVVLASNGLIESIYATKLGAVRLSEQFGSGQGLAGQDYERMRKAIDKQLRRKIKDPILLPHLLFGSGGTFTALAEMVMASKGQVGLPIRGYEVSHAELRHLLDHLRKLSYKSRRAFPGLSSDRADIIVAGLAIVDRLLGHFHVNRVLVHNRGVHDGLLLTMIRTALGESVPVQPLDADAEIDSFAARCGSDLRHEHQVARLAGIIYRQLIPEFDLNKGDVRLLEAAAKLQDVGYLINYQQHHKHSYHLILNSGLPGFQPRELALIANVARYHRGAEPKSKHANFKQLSSEDKDRVRRLAAILRIAGGLDRSHSQQVHNIRLERRGGTLEFLVEADHLPEVDLWGARRRTSFFEKVFKTPVSVEWDSRGSDQNGEQGPPSTAISVRGKK